MQSSNNEITFDLNKHQKIRQYIRNGFRKGCPVLMTKIHNDTCTLQSRRTAFS